MPLNIRFDREIAVLSNFGRLMNDPRYVDAARDIDALLDRGHRRFILELGGVRETGSTVLGLLTTLTRRIRLRGGEAVLANPGRDMGEFLDAMRMDAFWDVFEGVDDATAFFRRHDDGPARDSPPDEGSRDRSDQIFR